MKRIFSWVLALVMIISLLPAVTVLPAKAADVTSVSIKLWEETFTISSETPALYWVNDGSNVPTSVGATEQNYNYAFHYVLEGEGEEAIYVPTLSLRNAVYNVSGKWFLKTKTTDVYSGRLDVVYEGTNTFTLPAASATGFIYAQMAQKGSSDLNIIGKEGAVLNVIGGNPASDYGLIYFDAKYGHFDFIGGEFNVERTTGSNSSYGLIRAKNKHYTLIKDCKFTVTNTKSTGVYPTLYLCQDYTMTIEDSEVTVISNAIIGLSVSQGSGSGPSIMGPLLIKGASKVLVDLSSCTKTSSYGAAINASKVTLETTESGSPILEAIDPKNGRAIASKGTALTPILENYNDGNYKMMTAKDVEAEEYTATGYLKLIPTYEVCPHTFEVTVPGYKAKCDEPGLSDGTKCYLCDATVKEQTQIPQLSVNGEHTPGAEATCTTGQYCTECGKQVAEPNGHNIVPRTAKAPTCTTSGQTNHKYCTVCKRHFPFSVATGSGVTTQYTGTADFEGSSYFLAPTHTAGEAVLEEGTGEWVTTCTACGVETSRMTEEQNACEHETTELAYVAPTCTTTGLTEGAKCTVCDAITLKQTELPITHQLKVEMDAEDAENHYLVCQVEGCTYSVPEAHVFDEDNKCSCGFENLEEEPECTEHEFDDDCTTADTCKNCDAVAEATAHVAKAGKYTCDQAIPCANCSKNYREAGGECTPETDDNNCATALKCSVCEKEITPAADHVAEEGEYTCDQVIPCANCDQNYREAGECTPETDDKDCTTALKCSVCKKEITPAADNHAYAEQWNAEGKKPCANANCNVALACEHTYDCGFCTECGVEDMGTGYVATAAGKKYKSLAAAIYYANGAEVKLLKNVTYSALTITKDTKINLDGKMLYIKNSAAASAITVNAGKTLEIVGGDLRVTRGNAFTALIENNGNLVVTDVVIRGTELGGENAIVLLNKGTATVKGTSAVVAASNANYSIVNKGTCEINIAEANGVKARIQGVLAQEEGELTLTSIRLLGKLTYAAGEVTKAEVVSVTAPSGYIWDQNVLEVKNPIVEVNGVKYASLQDAIAKANGEQINLLQNVYVGALEITKDAKINIGAYKLFIKQTEGKTVGITINTGVTLTLMGGDLRVTGDNTYAKLIENNGKLVVDNVVIRGTEMGNANAVVLDNKGEAEINNASCLIAVARENCAIVNTGSCVINIAKTDAVNARIYGAIDNDGELDEKVVYQHFGDKI